MLSSDKETNGELYMSSGQSRCQNYSLRTLSSFTDLHPVMGSSYVAPPPGTHPAPPVDPTPKQFYHLESNRALPRQPSGPERSEVQVSWDMKQQNLIGWMSR